MNLALGFQIWCLRLIATMGGFSTALLLISLLDPCPESPHCSIPHALWNLRFVGFESTMCYK
ncbi:hypothetical protein K493DRAFT_52602 [Basidiobolus meristosporus CBS 931.73]|uniref:Uncharacterized protein n=1 Tax=Basidiobolus meristosporus CBS 931.73 TaxID=1314790 RepID=A0A1Y1XZQ8_9FUNG|nr:hypothetical protein K493DRAFT_52602 [Basidiobolus meristosporus CBS 931.73]|eukprot:ORX91250.1 hypothetical protein K493DRAFT_52602 [Basidiobolus meristosporus CBS 931.73]